MRWYASRAAAMPPAEYAHRARTAVRAARDRSRPAPAIVVPAPAPGWPRLPEAPTLVGPADVAAVSALPGVVDGARRLADALVEGRITMFGHGEVTLPADPDWNLDLTSGHRFAEGHWSTVEYRRSDGDPKWLWELGRHLHLVHLARAWRLTGDDRYAAAVARQLEGFLRQCPPGMGIQWRVGLELGLRLISWAFIAEFLRGSDVLTPALGRDLLASADAHMAWLERYPSLYSSANNHRLGELAGLVVGGLAFPELPRAQERYQLGMDGLCAELDAQTHPDGVNAEQAVYYHQFVLDLLVATTAVVVRAGRPVPDGLARPLKAMADVAGTLASDSGSLPAIGDNDDAVAIDLASGADDVTRLRSRLRTVSVLVGEPTARLDPGLDEQFVWLCGAEASARPLPERRPGSAVFPAGGLVVLRRRDDAVGELRAVLRAGPFGLAPIYAHAHADQLSVCVSVDGEEALVDAGTFTYYGDQRWRDYARSTGAHSTLRVDGRDQATPSGAFLWRRPVDGVVDAVTLDGAAAVRAHHDGYAPVRHERTLTMDDSGLVVEDRLTGVADPPAAELRWHLAPGDAVVDGSTVVWTGERARVALTVTGADDLRVVTGCASAPVGFRSTGLETWEPSPTVIARCRPTRAHVVVTRIVAGRR